jgi:hypothetical protein
VELHEFHVLERQAGAQHHGVAVARAGMGRGRREIGAAVAPRRQDGHRGAKAVDLARGHVQGDDAPAAALLIHDEVDGEVLDEEIRLVAHRLTVERVQDGVAGAICSRAGALRDALAELGRHAPERALVDLALVGAREGHAPMFELVHGRRRVADEVLDRVLVTEPIRPFHGVVHVPAPVVRTHIAERGRDAALRRDRVRACREDLRDAGGAQARLRAADRRPQPRPARADHDHVEGVVDDRVGVAVDLRAARPVAVLA